MPIKMNFILRLRNVAPAMVALSMMASTVSGCATVLRGPNTDFNIVTEPPGAFVQTDLEIPKSKRSNEDVYSCQATPCSFEVSRRSNFTVSVALEDYHPDSIQVTSGFGKSGSGASAAGAVTGAAGIGILFLGVDLASGAMLDVRPNPLVLILIPDDQPLPVASETFIETEIELEDVTTRINRSGSTRSEASN
nr:hypothetical protein [Hyphomonas sp. Mor2]